MNRRIAALALALGGALLFAPGSAMADDRLEKAIYHIQEAITQGKLNDAGLLAYHADLALEKAEAVEKFKPDPHTADAIVHIKAAIEEGRQNHAKSATAHAEEALKHLQEAAK
ncbi:MAG: hypothetical protein C3F11_16300 [Methylocystaceae bacterium]|nr:MAG: hypothetical protein C3F11_16300 [Methylocystaceae bacterium]